MGLPLSGLTIVEMAGLGPGPFAAMMLADHGARVIRVERDGLIGVPGDPLLRHRHSMLLDLRRDEHRDVVRRLAARADGLVEGFRPGVMERLGLGPRDLQSGNPRLVYGRVTGWGQDGPLAGEAGHDINYLALTGLLHAMGEPDRPPRPPLNLIADYAGGGMMLAFGMVAALLDVQRGASGRIVDAAMVDGAALTGTLLYGMRAAGMWSDSRGANLLDGGSPTYGCYACADGRFLALGAIEPQFVAALYAGLGLEPGAPREAIAAVLATEPRDEWVRRFAGKDACVAPVLEPGEAARHPHNVQRSTFRDVGGAPQPAPAPRYVGEAFTTGEATRAAGAATRAILAELDYDDIEIDQLMRPR